MRGQTIIIVILAILLVIALGFIGYSYWSIAKIQEQQQLLQQGAQFGYEQAFLQIFQRISTSCDPVPLVYNNVTIDIVPVRCLQPVSQ